MELIKIDNCIDSALSKDVIVCIGEFDGIHIAHQALINKTIELAKKYHKKTAIISFFPHPDYVIGIRSYEGYLTLDDEKNEILSSFGLDYSFVIEFSKELSRLSKEEFYDKYLKGFSGVVCGFDFRFGFKGEGDTNFLKSKFEIFEVIEKLEYNNHKIGSNEIREYLRCGNIEVANTLLGRCYSIRGKVLVGSKLGRTIGFPTANININIDKFMPKVGVYSVKCNVNGKWYLGFCNIGNNPTFNTINYNRLEVHLFDFDGDLYGDTLNVLFLDFIREEHKFDSIEELKEELQRNKEYTINKFGGKI